MPRKDLIHVLMMHLANALQRKQMENSCLSEFQSTSPSLRKRSLTLVCTHGFRFPVLDESLALCIIVLLCKVFATWQFSSCFLTARGRWREDLIDFVLQRRAVGARQMRFDVDALIEQAIFSGILLFDFIVGRCCTFRCNLVSRED